MGIKASDAALGTGLRADVAPADSMLWRDYVLNHPAALPYHHPAWAAAIADAYGWESQAVIVCSSGGAVVGGTPFVAFGGRMRPRRWVSLPFTDYCPPLGSADASAADIAGSIVNAGLAAGVARIEIRAPLAGYESQAGVRGVTHELTLCDPDELSRTFKAQFRRNIRKAECAGVEVRVGGDRDALTRVYYRLHVDTRRRLGVPSQPRRFFEALWRHVIEPGFGFLLLAYHGSVAVAGAVFLTWNGRVVYKYGASDRRYWSLRPNNLLFWQCIRSAYADGAGILDFGRTDPSDDGLRTFKGGWGATERSLIYTNIGASSEVQERTAQLLRPLLRAAPAGFGRLVGAALYRLGA